MKVASGIWCFLKIATILNTFFWISNWKQCADAFMYPEGDRSDPRTPKKDKQSITALPAFIQSIKPISIDVMIKSDAVLTNPVEKMGSFTPEAIFIVTPSLEGLLT